MKADYIPVIIHFISFRIIWLRMHTEKPQESHHVENATPEGSQYVHIEPALEKQVVRKLDWNFVPLVVALCKCSLFPPSGGEERQQKG